jgi:hypothetical protein
MKTTNILNPEINSKINTKNKPNHLENLSSKTLEDNSIFSTASDMDTDSNSEVSAKSDRTEPHVSRTIVDSVTAVLAVQKLTTGSQSSTKLKHLSRSRKNSFLRVLLDTGSDGDLMFHKKGTIKRFPYLNRQVPKSWHTSNGCFHTKGRGEVTLKFIEYSNSKEYTVNPDVVEYDGKK